MRQLTLKDFLSFYTPCLSCGNKNTLVWGVNYKSKGTTGEFSTNLTGKLLEIDIKMTYFEKFSIMIDITSHAFISSDSLQFLKYIAETNCNLMLKCNNCNSHLFSSTIIFDLDKRLIKPITVTSEMWHMIDEEYIYNIYTITKTDQTELIVDRINSTTPLTPWRRIIEAMPINKYSSKEDFLDRIKTYMVFS